MASHSGPRNYLAPPERRRVFWLLMPPALVAVLALGWIERAWFPRRGVTPAPQVDTRLAVARGAAPAGEAVLIEPEPDRFEPTAGELSASVESLAKIRDDSFFRRDEQPAWIETWLKLRSADPATLRRAAAPVSFTEMFGQPRCGGWNCCRRRPTSTASGIIGRVGSSPPVGRRRRSSSSFSASRTACRPG
jgi:hypothetical protein